MVEITDRVMSTLLPGVEDESADEVAVDQIDGDQFTDADDEPISLD